jgi:Lrp/AsnC family transcriptional regulator, leucine-responsive regulatory protein
MKTLSFPHFSRCETLLPKNNQYALNEQVKNMHIDRFDRHILTLLQKEGRLTNQELAEAIGLSPSPCLRRVRQLEESGIISGYRAQLNADKLGLSLMALIHIVMDRHTPERFANFEQRIAELPEVLECLLITGQQADYQIKVIVQDMNAYQLLLLNKITRIEGVTGVHSSFVLRRVIDQGPLPIP